MRWEKGRRSTNIEDRRRSGGGRRMSLPVGRRGGFSLGSLVVALVLMYFLGINPLALLTGEGPVELQVPQQQQPRDHSPGSGGRVPTDSPKDELADFVAVVLGDTEDAWHEIFTDMGRRYEEPTLVLFRGFVQSACGFAQSATGPFYCPADRKVYIDLSFYDEMRRRFGAPGDFAQAYVIAHEIGHHVQTLLGISDEVMGARRRLSEVDGNRLSVMQELQADCFAGVWANNADKARNVLEQGDVEEGLNAAAAIGDDRIQRKTQGYVVPDAFTHGSSEQRVKWFRRGLVEGRISVCDTFSAESL